MQDRMSNQDRSGISARNTYTASIMQSCDLCSFPSLEWGGLRLEGVIVSEELRMLTVVLEQLFDEVDMSQDHSTTAISLQPKFS